MARPTKAYCEPTALLHNLNRVKQCAPHRKIVAMVKANAYGCGIENVAPLLDGQVDILGVASFEEAAAIRRLGVNTPCLLLQGVFSEEEWAQSAIAGFSCVIHTQEQLQWLCANALPVNIHVWIKVDTGMHRLGFMQEEVEGVFTALQACPWVHKEIVVMTHFACADELGHESNTRQIQMFNQLMVSGFQSRFSLANSAAILSLPHVHADIVRPGIMLYGVSPFDGQTGLDLGLKPVMHFVSAITSIKHYPPHSPIGYAGAWSSDKPSTIGILPAGYGDGYPRRILPNTPVWVNGSIVPIVGRVSMDMMMVDLTTSPHVKVGDSVELWGTHIPVKRIAASAGTIAYELLTKITPRVRLT